MFDDFYTKAAELDRQGLPFANRLWWFAPNGQPLANPAIRRSSLPMEPCMVGLVATVRNHRWFVRHCEPCTAVGRITAQSFVVVATHGQYDELAIEHILQAAPGYLVLVASRTRAEAIRSQLLQQGNDPEQLRAMRAPAGIDIGARRGDEIALSIMAEIVAFRHGREQNTAMQPSPRRTEHKQPEIVIDPVCGMEVAIAGAQHHYLLEDPNYYFCCPGCRGRFIKNPQRFLSAVHDPTN